MQWFVAMLLRPWYAAAAFTAVTVALALAVGFLLWILRRPQRRYWRAMLWLHLGLYPLHLFLTYPGVLGYVVSRHIPTRQDERGYEGPRLGADGHVLLQDRTTLRAEREAGKASVPDDVVAAARARMQLVDSTDGVKVRTFRLEAKSEPPVAVAVLVHGLFRSSIELEPVASMLYERGLEVWLVEMRNHGGSGRAPFSGGLHESEDVVAAVAHVRAQPGRADTPLVLFGVSLGTVAVSYALPRIDGVAGVVLDAPIDDLTAAAHRMMTFQRPGDRRSRFLYEPWRSLVLTSLGMWSGFRVADVAPIEVLATLPHDLPITIVGESEDDRAPPDTVRALFDRLPMQEPTKELVEFSGVGHGNAFVERPKEYDEALGRLLSRLRGRR